MSGKRLIRNAFRLRGMTEDNHRAEASTAYKLDATDDSVGNFNFDNFDWAADSIALDDERFLSDLAFEASARTFRAFDRLKAAVRRGARRTGAVLDDDTVCGLAQQAYTRVGDRTRQAFALGRAHAEEHGDPAPLPEPRRGERRDRRAARNAKRLGLGVYADTEDWS